VIEGTIMMVHLWTGLVTWTVASITMGLMCGNAMRGYLVQTELVPVPVDDDAEENPQYRKTA
jgi:hypothetical protein